MRTINQILAATITNDALTLTESLS